MLEAPARQSNIERPVFLSYARSDEDNVASIEAALKAAGVPVFRDSELRAGSTWDVDLVDAIGRSSVVVLCWSRDSQDSFYVRREGQVALAKSIPFVNVSLEPAIIPLDFAHQQAFRFDDPSNQSAQWVAFVERIATLASVGIDPNTVRRNIPGLRVRSTGYVGWWFDLVEKKDYEAFVQSWSGTVRFWIAAFCVYHYTEHVVVSEIKRVLKNSIIPNAVVSCRSKEIDVLATFCQMAKGQKVEQRDYWITFLSMAFLLAVSMSLVRGVAQLSGGRRRINYVIGFIGGCALFFGLVSTIPGSFNLPF